MTIQTDKLPSTLKFQQIYDIMLNYIKTNCHNIDRLNVTPYHEVKWNSAWSLIGGIEGDGKGDMVTYARRRLISNFLSKGNIVTNQFVNNSLTSLFSNWGITNLNTTITEQAYYKLINNIAKYCSVTLCMYVAGVPLSNNSIISDERLIYIPNNVSNASYENLSDEVNNKEPLKIMRADVNTLLNDITSVMKNNIRCVACQYDVQFSKIKY